jgi:hypothetical protein
VILSLLPAAISVAEDLVGLVGMLSRLNLIS